MHLRLISKWFFDQFGKLNYNSKKLNFRGILSFLDKELRIILDSFSYITQKYFKIHCMVLCDHHKVPHYMVFWLILDNLIKTLKNSKNLYTYFGKFSVPIEFLSPPPFNTYIISIQQYLTCILFVVMAWAGSNKLPRSGVIFVIKKMPILICNPDKNMFWKIIVKELYNKFYTPWKDTIRIFTV